MMACSCLPSECQGIHDGLLLKTWTHSRPNSSTLILIRTLPLLRTRWSFLLELGIVLLILPQRYQGGRSRFISSQEGSTPLHASVRKWKRLSKMGSFFLCKTEELGCFPSTSLVNHLTTTTQGIPCQPKIQPFNFRE